MIKLYVCGQWLGELQIDDEVHITFGDVKKLLYEKSGVLPCNQHLIISGKTVPTNTALSKPCSDIPGLRDKARIILLDKDVSTTATTLRSGLSSNISSTRSCLFNDLWSHPAAADIHNEKARDKAREIINLAIDLSKRTKRHGDTDGYKQFYTEIQGIDNLPIDDLEKQALTEGLILCGKAKEISDSIPIQWQPINNEDSHLSPTTKRDEDLRESSEVAILIMLRASVLFQSLNRKVQQSFDNDAYMYLDLVWLLFKTERLDKVPLAEDFIQLAMVKYEKSDNKCAKGVDKAIRSRLYFLKGVVEYLRSHFTEAFEYLIVARRICWDVMVSSQDLATLLSMGFDELESKRALMAIGNDGTSDGTNRINKTVEFICEMKATKRNAELRREEKTRISKLEALVGFCKNGEKASVGLYEKLYNGHTSARVQDVILALRERNNDEEACCFHLSRIITERMRYMQSIIPVITQWMPLADHSTTTAMPIDVQQGFTKLNALGFSRGLIEEYINTYPDSTVEALCKDLCENREIRENASALVVDKPNNSSSSSGDTESSSSSGDTESSQIITTMTSTIVADDSQPIAPQFSSEQRQADSEIAEKLAKSIKEQQKDEFAHLDVDISYQTELVEEWIAKLKEFVLPAKWQEYENEKKQRTEEL